MESQLRQLGLQIKLESGKYYLLSDYVVCQQGEGLTPEQAKMIVRSFINSLILFRNILVFKWMSLKSMYFLILLRMENTKRFMKILKKLFKDGKMMIWKFKK